jgi:hypothetical protein
METTEHQPEEPARDESVEPSDEPAEGDARDGDDEHEGGSAEGESS